MSIIVDLSRAEKRRLRVWIRRETDAGLRTRMSIILHLARGRPAAEVAASLHLARSTVYRVAQRFSACGWVGLAELPRIRLHFVPPCSPEPNRIERVWLDLHAEATRNHRCATIDELLAEVHHYLKDRNRRASRRQQKAVA